MFITSRILLASAASLLTLIACSSNDAVQGAKSVSSDMYFLQIRPFRKDYRAAESQAGGQGGSGPGSQRRGAQRIY